MICPYRYVTKSTALGAITVEETEEYATCHGEDCPFFDGSGVWQCLRAKAEYKGSVNEYEE